MVFGIAAELKDARLRAAVLVLLLFLEAAAISFHLVFMRLRCLHCACVSCRLRSLARSANFKCSLLSFQECETQLIPDRLRQLCSWLSTRLSDNTGAQLQ